MLLCLMLLAAEADTAARWARGEVRWGGEWRPAVLCVEPELDPQAARRRTLAARSPEARRSFAKWCEHQGLAGEARAQWQLLATLVPNDPAVRRALGQTLADGRWDTPEGHRRRAEAASAARQADARWAEEFRGWRKLPEELPSALDERGLHAVETELSLRSSAGARLALRWLATRRHPAAGLSLARHALGLADAADRHAAALAIRAAETKPVAVLFLAEALRPQTHNLLRELGEANFAADLALLEGRPEPRAEHAPAEDARPARARAALTTVAGRDLGDDPAAWMRWNAEDVGTFFDVDTFQIGEAQRFQSSSPEPYSVSGSEPLRIRMTSCFAAGTPVWTARGLRAIDRIEPGDRVLSRDLGTGELAFQAVAQRTLRPTTAVRNLKVAGDTLPTTFAHPFWVEGRGWLEARHLEPGMTLRLVDRPAKLEAAEPGTPAQGHNLILTEGGTYFVGRAGVLVHDNTPILDPPEGPAFAVGPAESAPRR